MPLAAATAVEYPNSALPVQPRSRIRITEIFTSTRTWECPAGVSLVVFKGCGPGGGGASALSATQAPGGGASGQPVSGEFIPPEDGGAYPYTHGAKGAKGAGGFGVENNGADGGLSSFTGPTGFAPITMRGGKGGLKTGAGGASSGATADGSFIGYKKLATSAGGAANSGTLADPGAAADGMDGGLAGAGNNGGGGGGSSPFGQGGSGGASGAVGNAPALPNSGAGGGAAGAGDATNSQNGADGAEGFFSVTYDL